MYLAVEGSLPLVIDGDGEEVDELMPFVWMPGGTGRLTLVGCDCVAVVEGAIVLSATNRCSEMLMRRNGSPQMSLSLERLCPSANA